jgi:hypothetical protein
MARLQVADGGDDLQILRIVANILNKQSRTADKGWSSSFGVGRGANNTSPQKKACYEMSQRASDLDGNIKKDEMCRACSTKGEKGMHIGYWWENQKERGRPRRRWVDNIKMDLRWHQ